MTERVSIEVRGKLFEGWTSVELTRSIETASGVFEIESPGRPAYPLTPGDAVSIFSNDELILKGHIDEIERELDGDSSSVRMVGRDLAGDLVDCSAKDSPTEWRDVYLPVLVAAIATPFGVQIDDQSFPTDPFPLFRKRPGDTAWALIERACRLRGILVYSDGTGSLVLREPGVGFTDCELVEGDNLESASYTTNDSQRFGTYRVLAQRPGSDAAWGDLIVGIEGRATDSGVRSTRSLTVIAEAGMTNQTAEERAQWEATVRAARAARMRTRVSGWREFRDVADSKLWAPNRQIVVRSPELDLDRYLLITTVTFRQEGELEQTNLELSRADAFKRQPDLSAEDDISSDWKRGANAGEGDGDEEPTIE